MHTGEKTRDEEITKGVLHRKYGYLELDKSRPLVYLEGVRGGGRKMGDPVGYRQRGDSGVYATQLLGRNLLIHRLVWLYKSSSAYHYGDVPKLLDHINRDDTDNRYGNLRPADPSLNGINSDYNGEGYRGVTAKKTHSGRYRWIARLCDKYLGTYDTAKEAGLAYDRELYRVFGAPRGLGNDKHFLALLNFPEERANYLGLGCAEQLEFPLFGVVHQRVLDFSDVKMVGGWS